MNRALRRFGAVLAVASLALQACASPVTAPSETPRASSEASTDASATQAATPADPIKIGVVLPLTGANAPGGLDVLNGYKTGIELVNGAHPEVDLPFAATEGIPCLGGAKLELVSADHTGDPQRGASETERLITEEGIDILGDQYFSSVTAASQPVAERYEIPFLTSNASSPTLSAQGLTWWFRTGPNDDIYTRAMFEFMQEFSETTGNEISTIGLFYEDTLFGQGSSTSQKALAPEFGMEVVEDVAYKAQATSLSSEVLRLKSANPDVVLISSFLADSILFYTTLKDLDYMPPMIIAQGGSPGDPAFLEASGEDAEGLLIRSAWSPELVETNDTVAQVADMYAEIADREMGSDAPLAVQGVLVIADALERACSADPAAVREALAATDLSADALMMPWDGVRFDETTHQNVEVGVVIRQLENSTYHTVWPSDIAAMDPIYPLTPWSDR